jgi:hypothetical protein
MVDQGPFQLESAGALATLYITGALPTRALPALYRAFDNLPDSVRVLRVSLDDLEQLGESAPTIIHEMRRHWQTTRTGGFRLSFRGYSAEASISEQQELR